MKKTIIASVLGLTLGVVSSYGQGSIAFDTYDMNGESGLLTTYGNGPFAGQGLGNTFTGELLYSATAINDSATTAGTAGSPLNAGWSVALSYTFATPGNVPAGYIISPNNFNYTGSAGTTLYFEVVAFNGSSYANSSYSGHSASFTANLVTGTTLPNADQLDNLQGFQVYSVPEPTTLALAGLGIGAFAMLRRRKV